MQEKIKKMPYSPGVYYFLGKNKKILYIGRATSLKDRVKSYFSSDLRETRGLLIEKLVSEAKDIDFTKTDSVLEAVILEADLIKKFQPPYNTKEKSDKSFNCVVITKEEFPQVLVMRKRDIEESRPKIAKQFLAGPFPNGTLLKEALKIIRKIFPWRDEKCFPEQGKPCFNRQIGLCPGICTGEISAKQYKKIIRYIVLFLGGKKKNIIASLKKEMKFLAKKGEFEKAGEIKKKIFALKHIQDVALIKDDILSAKRFSPNASFRIEAYDIAHISGKNMVGAMVALEDCIPDKNAYRKFIIHGQSGADDTKALGEILERRLKHREWPIPNLIVIDGGIAQKNTAEKVILSAGFSIPVVSVVKDTRHKAREILGDQNFAQTRKKEILLSNHEAHRFAISYHKKKRDKIV